MGERALCFLIFVATACTVQSDLKVSQVYKTLTSRIDIEVMLIKVTAHSNNRNSKSSREVILGSVRL